MRYQSGLLGLITLAMSQASVADEAALRLIVKYKQSSVTLATLKTELSKAANLPVSSLTAMAGGAYVLTFDKQDLQHPQSSAATVLASLRKNPKIAYAVEDRIGHFKPLPSPSFDESQTPLTLLSHESQWDEFLPPAGVMLESAPGYRDGAWFYTTGKASKPVVIAVLDTGVALNDSLMSNLLKDQKGNIWGWNFAANNNDVRDETGSWHGTHVAGTIAGYGNVMIGMGEDLKILPLKIPDSSGMFYESQVINAIYWSVGGEVPGTPANPYPAKVLNMSFGVDKRPGKEIDHCDEALQEALFYARKQGAVIAVAAGNDNHWEHYNAPAVCNGTIKVAATGPEGLRSYYSNYGPSVSFAAPGGDLRYGRQGGILSTVNPGGGYQGSGFNFYQGTSMATPHVAGVAGLVFAASDNRITPERVEQILYATTHGFGQSRDDDKSCIGKKPCGHGILNANNAVKAAMANYDLVLTAPTAKQLALHPCKNGYRPAAGTLAINKTRWVKVNDSCEDETAFSHPELKYNEKNQIIAYYGAIAYRLDSTGFKSCELIGYDGIGCYF
ncbi:MULTISPECIES: S8 family serine peptidase [unclassified Legionella]|uniref:S8 family serine peptidase n=1 Tax=unclassified Legionella TaxID=2622702 RepID=UPI001055B60D|nr:MULTISPECIES: S8 family serine peptidase [unclassified Legionella]MDI9817946.1 S8 family serine peptidase [Legionella sp. PL877]